MGGDSEGLLPATSFPQPLPLGWGCAGMVPAAQHPWVPGPSCFPWSRSISLDPSRGEGRGSVPAQRAGVWDFGTCCSQPCWAWGNAGNLLPPCAGGGAASDGDGRELAVSKALVWGSSLWGCGCKPQLAAPRMDARPWEQVLAIPNPRVPRAALDPSAVGCTGCPHRLVCHGIPWENPDPSFPRDRELRAERSGSTGDLCTLQHQHPVSR